MMGVFGLESRASNLLVEEGEEWRSAIFWSSGQPTAVTIDKGRK